MATKTRWLLTLALLASCTEAEDEDQDGTGAGAGGEAGDSAEGEGNGLAACTPAGLTGGGPDCDQRYVCGCCPFDLLYDGLATEGGAVDHTMAWCGGHEAGYVGRTEASPLYVGTKFYGGSQEEIPERPSGSSEACRRCTSACRGIPGCSCCSKCGSCLAN